MSKQEQKVEEPEKVIAFIKKDGDNFQAFFQKGGSFLLCSPVKPTKIDALHAAIRLMEYPGYIDVLFP
jgi:hypothetical protein